MHRLLNSARNNNPTNLNKPLPEPLVDPDEGKTPIGELVIIPIQGKDLPNRERFGKQDPFILFRLGNVSKRGVTDVRGGQRPVWKDDQINIYMYESDAKDAKSLYVTCLDEDPKKNDLIGDCVINLAKVLEQGEQDDWFELSYKGREAGQLLLQLTYYSHDPNHPTNKMNRSSVPASGAAARRPIHPTNQPKPEEKPVEEDAHADEGPVYQPPVVPEAPVYKDPAPAQVPMVGAVGYPYGAPVAGRPVSPAGHGHYVGHHTPQVPPVNPYAPPANPYAPTAYPGYPTAGAYPGQIPHDPLADPKRLSFTGQPQPGYPVAPVAPVVPVAGYPPSQAYPPQVPVSGFPSQGNSPSFPPSSVYPPQNTGFPNTGYPATGASPFPAAQQLPITQGLGGAGGPPAGYPFAASNVYPPNNANNGGSGPGSFPNNNNNFGNNNNNNNNNSSNGNFGGNNNFGGNGNNGGNFNNNNGGNFNNGGSFNNNSNNNNGSGNFNATNSGGNFNNNFNNNNNNHNSNNGGNFNSHNSNNNFGSNSNNNFNNNNSNSFNNHSNNNFNNNSNNFNSNNSNNSNNSFNNNNSNNRGNQFSSNNSINSNNSSNGGYIQGGYSSPIPGNFTPKATPVVPKAVSPVTHQRPISESMYGPGGI
ncbi:hypothetical protein BGZ59_007227 [Podila verticillata]|uniref:C2 domain-containing protein n=1 Tax=Podila verticillata NRRL 6337 TaxID=1069443 RepID=A0A086TKA7_9FUNG|nr:hypothetical protein BGZ59_007227 [Podila verticillata]KFH62384.1 hypothetical protein MVEG_11593 [Podila verticillata NRRL 6337]